jgi:hypothetical protein
VKSELEAEIGNLLDPEGQKLPAQIEDDGERIRSLVARGSIAFFPILIQAF